MRPRRQFQLRILIATDQWFPDALGGVARVATETARRLADRGHAVTVMTRQRGIRESDEMAPGLRVVRVLPRTILPVTATDLAATAVAARRVQGPWDVLLGHSSTTAAGLSLAWPTAPMVRVFHASALRELRFQRRSLGHRPGRWATYGVEPILGVAERRSLRTAERVLILSEFSRGLLATDYPFSLARVVNVSGGVDTDVFAPGDGQMAARKRVGIGADVQLLLTVRRLEVRMGLEALIRAMAKAQVSTAVLAVAGVGRLAEALQRLADELGIAKRVRFLGAVAEESLLDWYRAADAFVLPTLAYEGFGMVTAEALATGTPVIGTPVGATPELLSPLDPRLISKGTGADEIATTIAEVLDFADSDLRGRCRRYAVDRLAWSQKILRWEGALVEAAAQRN